MKQAQKMGSATGTKDEPREGAEGIGRGRAPQMQNPELRRPMTRSQTRRYG